MDDETGVKPLPRSRLVRGSYLMLRRYLSHNVAIESAALAFYLLFTIFPLAIFFSALLGLLHMDVTAVLADVANFLPRDVVNLLQVYLGYVRRSPSVRLMLFGLFFSIYFPMRATNSLMRAVRTAYHLGPPRGAFRHLLKTLLYTVFLIITLLGTLTLLTVGKLALSYAVERFGLNLLIEVGLNVQPGQTLVLSSPVECAYFARRCAEQAYEAGCREVVMNWHDDALGRDEVSAGGRRCVWRGAPVAPPLLQRLRPGGRGLSGHRRQRPGKFQGRGRRAHVRAQQASGAALKEFNRLQMSSGFPWCIASIPIPSWARTVFPGETEAAAMDQLWDAIFAAVRISGDGTGGGALAGASGHPGGAHGESSTPCASAPCTTPTPWAPT
jgi:hypothetical protein